MISAYHSLVTYSEGEWEEYLEKIALIDIFGPLLKSYPDKGDFQCVIRYILLAYSKESEMLVIGSDWGKTKKKIFEAAAIKPNVHFYTDLVHLKNRAVLDCIKRWLDYQNDETFEMLQTLKDLKTELQMSTLTEIKKSSGEIDYDQKFKNAEYCINLQGMIKDLESQLIQANPKLKDSVSEYKEAAKSSKTMGLESTLK